ncbi:MAG TPA: serine hydrolase domain-containing protein, partial [Allosphingosinicella sp.]
MRFFTSMYGVAAMAALAIGGGASAAPPPPDFRAKADAILAAAYPADGPGAAVIVTRGGETLYSAGRGLADMETRRPITPGTVFRLGSITKQFTA